MINYFKAAERMLSERGRLDRALENLEHRLSRAKWKGMPCDIVAVDTSRVYASVPKTADALTDCLEVVELTREISVTKETMQEIDSVLDQLSADDALLLRAWYIERKSKEEIAAEMGYASRKTTYNLRNKAVAAFAVLYYGAGALSST